MRSVSTKLSQDVYMHILSVSFEKKQMPLSTDQLKTGPRSDCARRRVNEPEGLDAPIVRQEIHLWQVKSARHGRLDALGHSRNFRGGSLSAIR